MTIILNSNNYSIYQGLTRIENASTNICVIYDRYSNNPKVKPAEIPFEWEDSTGVNLEDFGFKYNLVDNSGTTSTKSYTFGERAYVSATYNARLYMQVIPPENFYLTEIEIYYNGNSTSLSSYYIGYAQIKTNEGNFDFYPGNNLKSQTFNKAKVQSLEVIAKHSNKGSYAGASTHICYIKSLKGIFIKPYEFITPIPLIQEEDWTKFVDLEILYNDITEGQKSLFGTAWSNGINDIFNSNSGISSSAQTTQQLKITFKDKYKVNTLKMANAYPYYVAVTDLDVIIKGYLNDVEVSKNYKASLKTEGVSTTTLDLSYFNYISSIQIELNSSRYGNSRLSAIKFS